MFDQVNGLPVHVLVVHAAVVFVPLLAVLAVAFAVLPRVRSRVDWAAALLAVAAPATAGVAVLSGGAFKDRLLAQGMTAEGLAPITTHQQYGVLTFWFTVALGVATGLLVFLARPGARSLPRAAELALSVVVVALAAVAVFYVVRTGDTGATSVWGARG
ncbi:MAG TPA: DUF2231 domain-containing protein [Actinoplanes sp.]|nr:DUF2231 domain-containing protein [Actinoplanes sp.]